MKRTIGFEKIVKKTKFEKKIELYKTQKILIIQIKRFNIANKINTELTFLYQIWIYANIHFQMISKNKQNMSFWKLQNIMAHFLMDILKLFVKIMKNGINIMIQV